MDEVALEDGYERHIGSTGGSAFRAKELHLVARTNGSIDLYLGPQAIKLGGQYQAIVRLTKQDVLVLFAEAYSEDVGDVIRRLAAALPSSSIDDEGADEDLELRRRTRRKVAARKRRIRVSRD
jgi:DNA primase large subunit